MTMGRIKLTGGYEPIPEGVHIFEITDAEYNENFGKLSIKLKTADGKTQTERYFLTDKNGNVNEGAMNAFSFFAKTALQDFTLDEIDEKDLIGHYISATATHNLVESTKKPGEFLTFVNLSEWSKADGFEGVSESVSAKGSKDTTNASNNAQKTIENTTEPFDLDSIL